MRLATALPCLAIAACAASSPSLVTLEAKAVVGLERACLDRGDVRACGTAARARHDGVGGPSTSRAPALSSSAAVTRPT